MIDEKVVDNVVALLLEAESVLFITGAGISAESGLPTYRGIGGLYEEAITEEGLSIEEALAGSTMKERPDITWKHLYQLEENCRKASYNRAHEIIAEMEREFKRVWVLTQNVDGFHYAAGSKNIIDIHGDMHNLRCTQCDFRTTVSDYSNLDVPPLCPECRSIVRPEVVLFGEMLPVEKLEILERELDKGFDLVFSVGTTSVFPYIAQPVIIAKYNGIPTIEINPGLTEISQMVDIKIPAGACETFELLWNRYHER